MAIIDTPAYSDFVARYQELPFPCLSEKEYCETIEFWEAYYNQILEEMMADCHFHEDIDADEIVLPV